MTNSRTQKPPSPLDYARRLALNARTSKLAIAAAAVSILASPFILVPFSNWINWYVPQPFNQCGRYGYLHFYIRTGAMVLATALSVAALIRIQTSGGSLRGKRNRLLGIHYLFTLVGIPRIVVRRLRDDGAISALK